MDKSLFWRRIVCTFCFNLCILSWLANGYAGKSDPWSPFGALGKQWRLLTVDNFTSELEKHEYALALSTLPWCGESRSLMKQIMAQVGKEPQTFVNLQLFVIYTNRDRLLGQSIFGSTSPSIALFRYGSGYRYHGRLQTASIMVSIRRGMSVSPSDLPLKRITSASELESFVESTDKAMILFDFCGWEQDLRHQRVAVVNDGRTVVDQRQPKGYDESCKEGQELKKETGIAEHVHGNVGSHIDTHVATEIITCTYDDGTALATEMSEGIPQLEKQKLQVDAEPELTTSGPAPSMLSQESAMLEKSVECVLATSAACTGHHIPNSMDCVSGVYSRDFSGGTKCQCGGQAGISDKVEEYSNRCLDEDLRHDQSLCTAKELALFEAVYRNVSRLAAASILTAQRSSFGVVTKEIVALQAGICFKGRPWFLVSRTHDHDRLPQYFYGEGDVEEFFRTQSIPLVVELEEESNKAASTSFGNDTPSVILFINRVSSSPGAQEASKAALHAVRAVAQHYSSLVAGRESGSRRRKFKGKEGRDTRLKDAEASAGHLQEMRSRDPRHSSGLNKLLDDSFDSGVFKRTLGLGMQEKDGEHVGMDLTWGQLAGRLGIDNDLYMDKQQPQDVLKILLEDKKNGAKGDIDVSDMLILSSEKRDVQQQKEVKFTDVESGDSLEEASSHSYKSLEAQAMGKLGSQDAVEMQIATELTPGSYSAQVGIDICKTSDSSESYPLTPMGEGKVLQGCRKGTESYSEGATDYAMGSRKCSVFDSQNIRNEENSEVPEMAGEEFEEPEESTERRDICYECVLLGSAPGETFTDRSAPCHARVPIRSASQTGPSLMSSGSNGNKDSILDRDCTEPHTDESQEDQMWFDEKDIHAGVPAIGFFFMDVEDQMGEKLTMSKDTPSLVMVDPGKQAHHVFHPEVAITLSSVMNFISAVLSGKLRKTILSESPSPPPRLAPRPPFVNRDFHEINPLPRVTVDTFSTLVLGSSEEGIRNSSDTGRKDVLVLFTMPWCGFCKRMELVVREVYQSYNHIIRRSWPPHELLVDEARVHGPTGANPPGCPGSEMTGENLACKADSRAGGTPAFLHMDCSLNDCSHHLGSILEEERYPAVVLFPAESKNVPVVYEGAPTVRGISEFVGTPWNFRGSTQRLQDDGGSKRSTWRDQRFSSQPAACESDMSSTSIKIDSFRDKMSSPKSGIIWDFQTNQVDTGRRPEIGSVMIATDKLLNVSEIFENSVVLVVGTPQDGILGIIINKLMTWENVRGLDSRVEALLRHAPLGYGGPIVEAHRPFHVLTHLSNLEGFVEVVPGVFYGFVAATGGLLHTIHSGKLAAEDFWFFLGYSSWTQEQFYHELASDFWLQRAFTYDLMQWPTKWLSQRSKQIL